MINIGDTVKIISNKLYDHCLIIGTLGKVTKIYMDGAYEVEGESYISRYKISQDIHGIDLVKIK